MRIPSGTGPAHVLVTPSPLAHPVIAKKDMTFLSPFRRAALDSPRARLLVISVASLYFELLLIRWLPTQIRVLAYFNNVILISCILGLGLGALLGVRRPLRPSLVFLLLAALMMLAVLYHGLDVKLPLASGDYFLWNGLSRAAKGTMWQYVALFVFLATNTALMVPIGQVLGVEFDRLPPLRAYLL